MIVVIGVASHCALQHPWTDGPMLYEIEPEQATQSLTNKQHSSINCKSSCFQASECVSSLSYMLDCDLDEKDK